MACMTLIAEPVAMATTQLSCAIQVEDAAVWLWETHAEPAPVRMSWVVVTDKSGHGRLQMCWTPSAGGR
jgi:hypothetical protein